MMSLVWNPRIVLLTVLLIVQAITISALPLGFIDEGVASRDAIITGAFAANPRNGNKPMLLLSTKTGQIFAVEDPDNSEDGVLVADLQSLLCTNGERGLQSIEPHPNFIENQYLYLFYSKAVADCPESAITGPPTRVSRFVVDPVTLTIDPATEFLILETSPAPRKIHNGGSMSFGVDGYLYFTTGDSGQREPSYSQDLTNLFGSILRVDENGDAPASNPFTTASGGTGVPCGKSGTGLPPVGSPDNAVCEEIFAYGLRNPFRLTMDYNSDTRVLFSIGDVGASVWEEISLGGENYTGVNYGWPMQEGPCTIGSSTDCAVSDDANIVHPYHFYHHTALLDGGCVTGSAYVPSGIGWPEKYKFLFIDFIFNETYVLIENPASACFDCIPPVPGYINETFYERDVMVDLFFGPYKDTQALYVISRGAGQAIRRIRYTGSTNGAPIANLTFSDDAVDINEPIEFDGSGSSNDAGEAITYLWDFGDGGNSTEATVAYMYAKYGLYTVKLTVTDALGQTNQAQVTIKVGIPPTAIMISPKEGDRFFVGQELLVLGNATDRFGELLNDTQIAWEVRQHHSEHYHPFLDRQAGVGNGFRLDPAPPPEDFSASKTSFLEIIMYATDSFGLVTTITRDVTPKKVFLLINSTPVGLQVLVDEYPVITPMTITSWENHKLRLNALDQNNMTFSSWSIGGERKTNFTVPARQEINPTILATFTSDVSKPLAAPVASPVTGRPVAATGSPMVPDTPVPPVASAPIATNAPTAAAVPVPDSSLVIGGTSDGLKIQRAPWMGSVITVMIALTSNFL